MNLKSVTSGALGVASSLTSKNSVGTTVASKPRFSTSSTERCIELDAVGQDNTVVYERSREFTRVTTLTVVQL